MNVGLMLVSVVVVAGMALLSVKVRGSFQWALRAGAACGLWALAWSQAGAGEGPVWLYFYAALMVSGFFMVAAFTTHLLWTWTGPGGSIVRGLFRGTAAVIVACFLYAFVAAPLAWALFDRCLFPTVEYEGECRYKPD